MRIRSMRSSWSGLEVCALLPHLFRVGCGLMLVVAIMGSALAQEAEPVGDFTVPTERMPSTLESVYSEFSSSAEAAVAEAAEVPAGEVGTGVNSMLAAEMERLESDFLELAKASGIPAEALEKDDWVQTLLKPQKFEKTESWQKRLESYGEIPIGLGVLDVESYDADTECGDWHFIPVVWPFLDAEKLASAVVAGSEYQPPEICQFGTKLSLPLDECVSLSEEGDKPVLVYPVTAKVHGVGRDQVLMDEGYWRLPNRKQKLLYIIPQDVYEQFGHKV